MSDSLFELFNIVFMSLFLLCFGGIVALLWVCVINQWRDR